MKKETYLEKLNKLLGIEIDVAKVVKEEEEKETGHIRGIPEEKIQEFREMQGIIYFLQAPALFQPRVCKYCQEAFLVSRLYVAYCSYDCIYQSLKDIGINWTHEDILFDNEKMLKYIQDPQIYNGQEPIWIRNLSTLEAALQKLTEFAKSEQTPSSSQEKPSSLSSQEKNQSSSSPLTTTGSGIGKSS